MSSRENNIVVNEGWGRKELYAHFAELGFKIGCEVGVKAGANAKLMLKTIPDLKLYLVEPYADYDLTDFEFGQMRHTRHFSEAVHSLCNRKHPCDVRFIIEKSEDGAAKIKDGSLDFVYIDGNHHYNFCMLDLILYSRKVRPGGIVSGHDYVIPGVEYSVNDYASANKIDTIYLTDRNVKGHTLDKLISWYFIKGE